MKKRKLLISAILMASSLFFSMPAYAAIDECIDADKDGYCDTCHKAMDEDVLIETSHHEYTKQGRAIYGSHSPGNWRACSIHGDCGLNANCPTCGQGTYWKEYCWKCGAFANGPGCTANVVGHEPGVSNDYGNIALYKSGISLKIKDTLTTGATVQGYSWKYNGKVISTDSECEINNIGKYTCDVTYYLPKDYPSGAAKTSVKTFTYGANADSFSNNVFYVEKTLKSDGYGLTLTTNPDYASYFTVIGYSWKGSSNSDTWDILPTLAKSGAEQTLFTQNCGSYECEVSYKGADSNIYKKTLSFKLADFDAKTAAGICSKPTFTTEYDYPNLQNYYNQAEVLRFNTFHKGVEVNKVELSTYDTNHELNTHVTDTQTVKKYVGGNNTVSEIIEFDGTFTLKDIIDSTCTKEGSTTLSGKVVVKMYLLDKATNQKFLFDTQTFTKDNTMTVGKNALNHDCGVAPEKWIDDDHDGVSEYLVITRLCPAYNNKYEIWLTLDEKSTAADAKWFNVSRTKTKHSTAASCETVATSVRYEYIVGSYKTYSVTENRSHRYDETISDADCLNPVIYHHDCRFCDYKWDQKLGSALGHNYSWVTTKQMTMNEDGIQTGTCARCGHIEHKTVLSPYKAFHGPSSLVAIDEDMIPDAFKKYINSKKRPSRDDLYIDLLKFTTGHSDRDPIDAMYGIGLSHTPGTKSLNSGTSGASNGFSENAYGIGEYSSNHSFWNSIEKFFKDIWNAILKAINALINFFKEHVVAFVSLILIVIAIIAVVISLIMKDKVRALKARKANTEAA